MRRYENKRKRGKGLSVRIETASNVKDFRVAFVCQPKI